MDLNLSINLSNQLILSLHHNSIPVFTVFQLGPAFVLGLSCTVSSSDLQFDCLSTMPPNSTIEQELVPPCKCHILDPTNWPSKNGTISLSLCMDTCPYCGQVFSSSFDLGDHLQLRRYRKRGLRVSATTGLGQVTTYKIPYLSYSSKTNKYAQ